MSGDYISREAAIKEVYRFDGYLDDDLEWRLHYALKKLPAADVVERPRWIPVTERLPEDGSLVGKLIADSDGEIRIASQCAVITLSGGKTVYTDLIDLVSYLAKDTPTTEWTDCTHITHWMQLPEPPEDGGQDA